MRAYNHQTNFLFYSRTNEGISALSAQCVSSAMAHLFVVFFQKRPIPY